MSDPTVPQPAATPQTPQRLQQLEQEIQDLQARLAGRDEQLAAAEALRDEARHQLAVTENRRAADRLLAEAGVVDLETASLLLDRRLDLGGDLDHPALLRAVEQLLVDKPFLNARSMRLPPASAAARAPAPSPAARLTRAAQRAASSGNRRDIADYLRLRRQNAPSI